MVECKYCDMPGGVKTFENQRMGLRHIPVPPWANACDLR